MGNEDGARIGRGCGQMHGSPDNRLVSFNLIRGWKIARHWSTKGVSGCFSPSSIEPFDGWEAAQSLGRAELKGRMNKCHCSRSYSCLSHCLFFFLFKNDAKTQKDSNENTLSENDFIRRSF